MIMLFHDAVTIGVQGSHPKLIPIGPPPRFEEVFASDEAEIIVCKPCAEARGITESMLTAGCRLGGMNDYHAHASRDDAKAITF